MTTKRPSFIQWKHWTPKSLRLRNTLSFLFVYEWPKISGVPTLCPEMIHFTWMCGKQKGGLKNTSFSADKMLLLQHWQSNEAQPRLSRPPLFLTPLALSPGAGPLYMPCSSAITTTQFLLKTVFPKLQKEPGLVQGLLRETVPLSLTMRDAESYSRKCFVKNFSLCSIFFCPQGYKWNVGLVVCQAGQRIKTQTASLIWKHSTSQNEQDEEVFLMSYITAAAL